MEFIHMRSDRISYTKNYTVHNCVHCKHTFGILREVSSQFAMLVSVSFQVVQWMELHNKQAKEL